MKSYFLRPLPANPHRPRRSSFLLIKKNLGVRRRLKNSNKGNCFCWELAPFVAPEVLNGMYYDDEMFEMVIVLRGNDW